MKLSSNKRFIYIHLGFWILYFSFFFYQIAFSHFRKEVNISVAFSDALFQIIFTAILSYFNYFYLIPRVLKTHKTFQYFILFIFAFIVIAGIQIKFKHWLYADQIANHRHSFLTSSNFYLQFLLILLFIVAFVGMLRFVEQWFILEAKKKEIENEKLSTELQFLKDQINPHFLFNTLNNLYYLAMIQSPNTTEVIEKLSAMMRYMLYDTNIVMIPIIKEIEYIQNYIALEKLRLDEKVKIELLTEGDFSHSKIVPLILITFLENAFKHGVSNNLDNSFVKVKLKLIENVLHYEIENSKLKRNHEKSGIGLKNVLRRLNLSYPEKYSLEKSETETVYKILLTINLK